MNFLEAHNIIFKTNLVLGLVKYYYNRNTKQIARTGFIWYYSIWIASIFITIIAFTVTVTFRHVLIYDEDPVSGLLIAMTALSSVFNYIILYGNTHLKGNIQFKFMNKFLKYEKEFRRNMEYSRTLNSHRNFTNIILAMLLFYLVVSYFIYIEYSIDEINFHSLFMGCYIIMQNAMTVLSDIYIVNITYAIHLELKLLNTDLSDCVKVDDYDGLIGVLELYSKICKLLKLMNKGYGIVFTLITIRTFTGITTSAYYLFVTFVYGTGVQGDTLKDFCYIAGTVFWMLPQCITILMLCNICFCIENEVSRVMIMTVTEQMNELKFRLIAEYQDI